VNFPHRIDSLGIEIWNADVGYGEPGVDGHMGYGGTLLAPIHLHGQPTISAHSPSRVRVALERPVTVTGFMNASAELGPPVEFYANHNWLGTATGAGDATAPCIIGPGEVTLECAGDRPNWHRHSVWAFAPADSIAAPIASGTGATPENTAIVTVAEYPAGQASRAIRVFSRSVAKRGHRLFAFGEGTKYAGHYEAKVVHLLHHLRTLPAHFRHILFADGIDCILARPLAEACAAFNTSGAKLLMSVEPGCWPIVESNAPSKNAFIEAFPPGGPGGRWINAGVWLGERDFACRLLEDMATLHAQLDAATPSPTPDVERFWDTRDMRGNDQHLFQCRYLTDSTGIMLDTGCTLAATVSTTDMTLGPANTYFDFDDEGVVLRANGARPSILHFTGWGHPGAYQKWASYLRLI